MTNDIIPMTAEAAQELIASLRRWKSAAKSDFSLYDCTNCGGPVMRGWVCSGCGHDCESS